LSDVHMSVVMATLELQELMYLIAFVDSSL
jgi:hypothetical protein